MFNVVPTIPKYWLLDDAEKTPSERSANSNCKQNDITKAIGAALTSAVPRGFKGVFGITRMDAEAGFFSLPMETMRSSVPERVRILHQNYELPS